MTFERQVSLRSLPLIFSTNNSDRVQVFRGCRGLPSIRKIVAQSYTVWPSGDFVAGQFRNLFLTLSSGSGDFFMSRKDRRARRRQQKNEPLVMQDAHRKNSDARLAARILSLGVVPEEKVARVLARSFDVAENAANNGNARDYNAALSVPLAAAKLELEREKFEHDKSKPKPGQQQLNVGVQVNTGPQQINLNVLSVSELRTLRELQSRATGTLELPHVADPAGSD